MAFLPCSLLISYVEIIANGWLHIPSIAEDSSYQPEGNYRNPEGSSRLPEGNYRNLEGSSRLPEGCFRNPEESSRCLCLLFTKHFA